MTDGTTETYRTFYAARDNGDDYAVALWGIYKRAETNYNLSRAAGDGQSRLYWGERINQVHTLIRDYGRHLQGR